MTLMLATPVNEIELAPGSAIRLQDVSWQAYIDLLMVLGDNRSTRVAYSHNILEIRIPGQLHETVNRLLSAVVMTLAEVLDLDCNNLGSTTLNRQDLARGIEPDSCFYIRSAEAGQGIAAPTSLPPDLAVEVDIASGSKNKMEIYAALRVSELWIYRAGELTIQQLGPDGEYTEVKESVAFAGVSAAQLNAWITLRKTGTDLTVIKAVRAAMT